MRWTGFDEQIYAILRTAAHDEYHKLLRECLDAKGIWYPVFKVGTHTGSIADWRLFFQENPGAQYQAFEAVIEAGTKLAGKYPDEAKKLFDAFWETMKQNKYYHY
jgi:hypothetical protein